jgi:serine/threonine protein kinase
VLGVLGRGGFGTVYRADLLGEGSFVRPVALKVLHPEMEGVATVAARLRDEARLLGRVRHRAIVQVDGLVRLDDRWTVVMEYVDGIDLGHLVESGPTPPRAAAEIIGEVAGALHVVQTWVSDDGRPLQLLHRDLKPANLLLTSVGEVKVLDFGVARTALADREAHTRGMRFGSPGYVAPERMDGEERPEGDVYSLGVVFYELLAGAKLGRSSVRRDRQEPFVAEAMERLAQSVPEDVCALVRAMLSYDAEGRPQAREVERRCRDLVVRLEGPFLRDWAETAVPPLLAARVLGDARDEFSADIVAERATAAGLSSSQFSTPPMSSAQSTFGGLDRVAVPPSTSGGVLPSVLEAEIRAEPARPQGRTVLGLLAELSVVGLIAVSTAAALALASIFGCLSIFCMGG